MYSVQELISDINSSREKAKKEGLTVYDTKSQKDELAVMKAMLNDMEYKVGVYDSEGLEYYYSPAKEIRSMISNVISSSMEIPLVEAEHHMNEYEFKNSDAQSMISFSKEFINTYLKTGRKLPLGGRETSNVSLIRKQIPARKMLYPTKVKKSGDTSFNCESKEVMVGAYDSVRVYGSCPPWVDNGKDDKK